MSASRQLAIGIFILGGVMLFAIGLFWIGDRRQLFSNNVELYAEFSNLSGLAKGAKVRVSGVDAGEVLELLVPPNPDSRFRVRFRVVSRFQSILRSDSVASIQTDGLVGNKFLQVQAGTSSAARVGAGATIPSREPIEISDLLAQASETVKAANLAVGDIRSGISQTVTAVLDVHRQTASVIRDAGAQVDKIVSTGNRVTEDVSTIVAGIRQGRGSLGKVLTDDGLYNQLRAAAAEGQTAIGKLRGASDDLKSISDDLKSRGLGAKIEQAAGTVDTLAKEATTVVRSFQGTDAAAGGWVSQIRQTLNNANEAMAGVADDSEALKRNLFLRGYFNRRGFFDLDAVTVRDYAEGRFLPGRQRVSEWLDSQALFISSENGREQISQQGKEKLDLAMATFLRYSRNEPFVIESWAGSGREPARVLRARERAMMVSEYLVKRFGLKSNYVAAMPMNAVAENAGQSRDGIGLVLFISKTARR